MVKVLLIVSLVVIFGAIVMYNQKILTFLNSSKSKSGSVFYRLFGRHMLRVNTKFSRASSLKKNSLINKIDLYFKEIISNLGLAKDNVTVVGLLTFIASVSFSLSFVYAIWSGSFFLFFPAFAAMVYFLIVLFRFSALLRYEKREAEIMDTQDLITMDIRNGVYNAIQRYHNSFHPNIKPYFVDFLDDINNKGYSFKDAMIILNEKLGPNFTDFAHKAISYEDKADENMDDIFSTVVEINGFKRQLRYDNNHKFNSLRVEFIVAIVIITLYGLFSFSTDAFLSNFFSNSIGGKVVLIADVVIVTGVLAYISSIKAKFM
jgi:hypothetical protein